MARIITKVGRLTPQVPRRQRVAAYARVSSGKDAMLQSLAAQVSYYSGLIQRQPDWEYAGVYADEALTGTKDNRPELQRLLADCRAGKVDRILTKSISRFARNTVTLLQTVRELKHLGVDVYFEEQNIHSTSADGELMLTILASYAQEESLSVSENCKWRIRQRFAKGELVGLRNLFGYSIHEGRVEIDPERAAIIRMIFEDYLSGIGGTKIARKLQEMQIPTLRGGKWDAYRVSVILRNEKYTGDALLQKQFVTDHLTKRKARNHGQLPQYYAKDTHPALIDKDTFDQVQAIIAERQRRYGGKERTRHSFSSLIQCGLCGKHYKRMIRWGKASWHCSTFLSSGKAACPARQVPEEVLQAVSAEVLGLEKWKADDFNRQIKQIRVPGLHRLIFVFRDGHTVEKTLQERSRRDSWTMAMRQAAREKVKGGTHG